MAWTSFTFVADDVLTSTEMTNLFDDFQAFADQSSGAPTLCNSYVNQGMFKKPIQIGNTNIELLGNQITYIWGIMQFQSVFMRAFSVNRYSGTGSPVLFFNAIKNGGDNIGCDNQGSTSLRINYTMYWVSPE